jgi:hypothetical protein
MDRRGNAKRPEDAFQKYAYTFRSILADIHFDVVGGDDRVRDLWIRAVDSPTIAAMTLDCEPPAYIRRKPVSLPVSGVMQIPMGSRLTVHAGAANKDLVRVQINGIVDEKPMPAKILETCDLDADHHGFRYALAPLMKDVTLLFTLTDTDGITSRDPVRLVLTPLPDQPPQLAVQLDGIGTAVTPQARVPVVGRITDDYGLGRAWFECAIDERKSHTKKIAAFTDLPTEYPLADAAFEVRELNLKPSQKLSVQVKATDRCDLGHGPNISSSERWMLDVVTPEQLRTMLESHELVLRQRFDRMIQEMAETRDILAHLEFKPATAKPANKKSVSEPGDEEPDDSPERQRALRVLRVQGALTNCRKSTLEVLGLAEAFDDIRKQLVNNRIDTEELKNRLQNGIADPLRQIAERMFPDLERQLDALQAVLEDQEKGPGSRDLAQRQADAILLAMQKIRDRMIELEDFNEAVELLRGIIKMQEDLHEQTQKRHKEKIRDLLKD